MESVLLSNPIYQHSGESQKDSVLAQQASINEDQEQRRRQLDSRGEKQKALLAKEVSHLVDEFGGTIKLKQTPYTVPKEPLLQQAQHATTSALNSALEAGKSLLSTASSIVSNATEKVSATTKEVADTAVHLGHDAAGYVQHVAQEAAHQASDISKKVVDSTSAAAGVVSDKTKELAEGAANKAYEIADNISHFTTLVSVLAEEENERARRLISGDEARAAANAFRVSELIRELDPCFYKQTPNLVYTTKVLEEAERRWRLNSSHASLAESNAHSVGKLVNNNLQSFMPRYQWVKSHISTLEEKERTRRLNDPDESYAIINAYALSEIIRELGLGFYRQIDSFDKLHASFATTLLEELERKNRIRLDKLSHYSHDNATLLSDVVANNMERFNLTTRHAAQFANEFANMVGSATKSIATNFSTLTQDFAKTAASRVKSVAGDIANYSTIMYVIALEERERARRLSDPDELTAINNAWIQSGLIRELEGLYRTKSRAVFPLSLIEEQERRWRMASLKPTSSRQVADIVKPNLMKFELAANRMAKLEHALDTAAHSKLNPSAPAFVPHAAHATKVEAPIQYAPPKASGAQF